jgi:hypothetical protein
VAVTAVPPSVNVLLADKVVNAPVLAELAPMVVLLIAPPSYVPPLMSAVVSTGLVMGSVPTSCFFSIAAIALKESLIPAGLQFSAMSIESMSVLLAAVALNSLIFVRGITGFPLF